MQQKINYVGLLILIIFGVAVGNLASSWVTAKYSINELEPEKATVAVPKALTEAPPKPVKSPEFKELTNPNPSEAVRETVKLSPDTQSEAEEIKRPADPKQLMEQRKLDENGVRLAKQCNEWTTVHKDMNTPSSERGMNKHCAEYYDYLSFGTLPNSE